jgi:NADH dehydrogenase
MTFSTERGFSDPRKKPDHAELERFDTLNTVQPTVLVLGGYGFIGRHIVSELEKLNARVLIGTRRQKTVLSPANERCIALHKLTTNPTWASNLNGVDVVINTVGILRQRWRESYAQVHHQAVQELADRCAQRRIRLIHLSALGLANPVKSRFLTSKRLGEQALMKSNCDWYLVRPSLVDGKGGYGAKWFRRVAKWPLYLLPKDALGILAPIKATQLGQAVAVLALDHCKPVILTKLNRVYELGGQENLKLFQYLHELRPTEYKKDTVIIKVPAIFARMLSHLCDFLHLTPFSFGHYELLKFDNYATDNRLPELLARHALYRSMNKLI